MAKVKKIKRNITKGRVYIASSFNNTIVSLTDMNGAVVAWSSAGNCGFKGARKNTPYAAQLAAKKVEKAALDMGMTMTEIYVNGPGQGKDAAVRIFQSSTIRVVGIRDHTPHPHNGCKLKKRRRM
ncbi:MAG: 30S ribosomal protein S11 [Candidatus Cloacimonadota bacterium]|nr:MAG: 30S ribosomal protein S11 [Candidatus Cloacimonadota bacterium]